MLTVTVSKPAKNEERRLVQLRLPPRVDAYFQGKIPEDLKGEVSLPALLTSVLEEVAMRDQLRVRVEE
jgi:hypothetical protein